MRQGSQQLFQEISSMTGSGQVGWQPEEKRRLLAVGETTARLYTLQQREAVDQQRLRIVTGVRSLGRGGWEEVERPRGGGALAAASLGSHRHVKGPPYPWYGCRQR